MAIPSRQIGWSTTDNLLWQISKQLEYLTQVTAHPPVSTTTTSSSTSTSTTTTTTTAAPSTLIYSSIDGSSACTQSGPFFTLTSVTYNGGTGFCDSSSFDSPDVDPLSGGGCFISDGTNFRTATKVAGAGITLITFTGACTSC